MTQTYSVAPTGQQHSSPGQSDAVKPRSVALGEANTAHAALKGRNRNSIGLALKPFLVLFMAGTVSAAPETSLFNGKDLSGWHADVPSKDKNPDLGPSFTVRDGLLVSLGEPRGHLITDKAYRDYRLDVEYRFPQSGGNCGVLVHASKPRALSDMFPQSIEVQMQAGQAGDFWCIQENIEVPEMESRRPRREGQEYGGGPSNARRILNLTDDSEKPLGAMEYDAD